PGPQGTRTGRPLPIPQREDAVILRRRGQGFFSLLWLRRARRCDRLSDARRQSRFYRGGRAAGGRGGDCGAAAAPAGPRAGAAPEDASGNALRRRSILREAAVAASWRRSPRIPLCARARCGDDPPLSLRLVAARPAILAPGAIE